MSNAPEPVIRFRYEGQRYELTFEAYRHTGVIRLPDGRLLRVSKWLESSPPAPEELTVIGESEVGDRQVFEVLLVN